MRIRKVDKWIVQGDNRAVSGRNNIHGHGRGSREKGIQTRLTHEGVYERDTGPYP